MEVFDHLLEWDQLDLRVRGSRVEQIVKELLQKKQLPVSDLRLEFLDRQLQVSARVQKGISIPVKLTVRAANVIGDKLHIPLENVATFGLLPVPKLVFRLFGTRGLPDGIRLDVDTLTVIVSPDRFLPPFIAVKIESMRFVTGGVLLHLGSGGADLPPGMQAQT